MAGTAATIVPAVLTTWAATDLHSRAILGSYIAFSLRNGFENGGRSKNSTRRLPFLLEVFRYHQETGRSISSPQSFRLIALSFFAQISAYFLCALPIVFRKFCRTFSFPLSSRFFYIYNGRAPYIEWMTAFRERHRKWRGLTTWTFFPSLLSAAAWPFSSTA